MPRPIPLLPPVTRTTREVVAGPGGGGTGGTVPPLWPPPRWRHGGVRWLGGRPDAGCRLRQRLRRLPVVELAVTSAAPPWGDGRRHHGCARGVEPGDVVPGPPLHHHHGVPDGLLRQH